MSPDCHPELDETPLLDDGQASVCRTIMGSAQWAVTLGHFDIHCATGALSRCNTAPREGHLKAAKQIFGCLYKFCNGKLLIDPNDNCLPRSDCPLNYDESWREFYPDACFESPPNAPPERGDSACITVCIDADHARDKVT